MPPSLPDADTLYAALLARDPAYDGHVFVGVRTTGVFCRLTCPARKPRPENARFFPSIPACFAAGFRPCLRCRPLERAGASRSWRRCWPNSIEIPRRCGPRTTSQPWASNLRPCAAPPTGRGSVPLHRGGAPARRRADGLGIALCLDARTDAFFRAKEEVHGSLLASALDRARAYAEAGASCFFAPGLADEALIGALCATVALPVNIMVPDAAAAVPRLARLGVARISEGPGPFMRSMAALKARAEDALRRSD